MDRIPFKILLEPCDFFLIPNTDVPANCVKDETVLQELFEYLFNRVEI